MAGEIANAFVALLPTVDKSFGTKIQQQMTPTAARAGDDAGRVAGSKFGGAFGGAIKGIGGLMAGAFAVQKVGQFFGSIISEATEAQKVGAITAQVIKTTGGAANVTADQIGDLSTAISNKVGIDDEAIQSGANLLLTFKNIRNEAGKGNDIFDQSTQVITDMSVAMGTDMKSSAIQVGKALNDPIKGITALTRVGVTFSEEQKKQIANFVEAGDVASAQKIILGELNSEFGGAAAAGTTAGEKLAVSWGNFKETLGTAVLPTLQKAQSFIASKVLPSVLGFFQSGGDKATKFGAIVGKFGDVFGVVFGAVKQFLTDNQATFLMWWASIKTIFTTLQTLAVTVLGFIEQFWTAHGQQIMAVVSTVWNSIKTIITSVLSIIVGIIRTVIALITGDWSGAWEAIKSVLASAWRGILAIIKGAWAILTAVWTVALSLLSNIWRLTWDAIETGLAKVWDGIKSLISGALDTVKGWISSAWDTVKTTTATAWETLKSTISTKTGEVITFVTGIPGKILTALGNLGSLLVDAGSHIIGGLLQGLKNAWSSVVNWFTDKLDWITGLWPFSPAKHGPLRRKPPHKWGENVGRMLAEGLVSQQSMVTQAATGLAAAAVVDPSMTGAPRGMRALRVRTADQAGAQQAGGHTFVYKHTEVYPFRRESSRDRSQAGVMVGLFGEFLGQPGGGAPIYEPA